MNSVTEELRDESRTEEDANHARIYLDNNATTRPLPEVTQTVAHHLQSTFANPGSRHAEGRAARRILEDARERIATILGADPGEVIFTSGGTESSNMALFGYTTCAPATILLTAGEHPATVESCKVLRQRGWKLKTLAVDSDGRLRPEQFDNLDWADVRLVTIILAHNETGVIQDISVLSQLAQDHNIALHVDAVQAIGKIPINFQTMGATSLALGAHKFHGPRGIGALLLRAGRELAPFQFGGHQESGRRPGTELVALAAGMARALEIWDKDCSSRMQTLSGLRDQLEHGLRAQCPWTVVNGSTRHRLPNTLNIAFPGVDGEALLVALDLEGISCSLGSTCASGAAEPAATLVAMKCPPAVLSSSVRFSLSMENTPDEVREAIKRISLVAQRLRATSTATV